MSIDEEIIWELESVKDVLESMHETEDLHELRNLRFDAWTGLNRYYSLNCDRLRSEKGAF